MSVVVVLAATLLAASLGVTISATSTRLRAAARTAAVADLVAGAGVLGGRAGADSVAGANGADVVGFRVDPDRVVTVEVRAAGRTDRASAGPAPVAGPSWDTTAGTRTRSTGSLGSPG
ncbi:MAG: hypothetical protein KGR17_07090 [Acidobacteria bacterium]|nr:hypothetical protein [Acidobacteriota bacterium]